MRGGMFRLVCLVLVLSFVTSSSAGLVAWFEFEGNVNDSSGNGYNGAVTGSLSYAAGNISGRTNLGLAAYGDGNNDYVTLPRESDFDSLTTSGLSVAAWVKRDGSWPDSGSVFVTKGSGAFQINRRWDEDYANFGLPGKNCISSVDMTDDT